MKYSRFVALGALFVFFISTGALAITPSAAQIEQLKQLPREQQVALAKQYGVDINDVIPSTNTANNYQQERQVSQPARVENAFSKDELQQTQQIKDIESTSQIGKANKEQALKLFGYDIFSGQASGFEAMANMPVPGEYILGAGDEIQVQLFGKEQQSASITIDRSGVFFLPELGPINVAGLTFSEFKTLFQHELKTKVIGVEGIVNMGQMRSIRVFVLGEVFKPGAYSLSALSTITHALYTSGGISQVGSLRNVQLKRAGKLVETIDLYDLLLKGDTSKDLTLLPGDVVFVPPTGPIVGVTGEVKRPALYEVIGDESVFDVLALAGNELATAYLAASKLERLDQNGGRTVVDVNLEAQKAESIKIRNGDVLRIGSVLNELDNVVTLQGHLYRPGVFSWKKGQRVLDVIEDITDLKTNPDLDYALIVREDPTIRTISTIQFSVRDAFNSPNSDKNPKLESRDKIYIFAADGKRNLDVVVNRLKKQARSDEPAKYVEIAGNVEYQGEYPLSANMTVNDLIKASYDFKEFTDFNYALLKRQNFIENKIEFEVVNLKEQSDLTILLTPKDKLYVFSLNEPRAALLADLIEEIKTQTSKTVSQDLVSVQGQVRFPGTYPLSKHMTAADLVSAAGGYTESSYLIDFNVARFNTNGIDTSEFDLQTIPLKGDALESFALQAKDSLFIKGIPDWVEAETVELMGEFKFPGKYTIRKGETLAELVERAGGFTDYAELEASVFTREYLRLKEQKILEDAQQKLKQQMVMSRYNAGEYSTGSADSFEQLLNSLEGAQAVGRMVVTTEQITVNDGSLELRDGDQLIVPRKSFEVSVLGQVYQPTTLPWIKGDSIDDYIDGAGGVNQIAEDSDTYLIKANGRVVAINGWFTSFEIQPGDSIMVPADVSPIPTLTLWQAVTTILAQSATTLALISTL
ncbi:SLBB domain-containing protein [Psychrosphaera sp. 1_MG-2023]|uniref:SLBB domain-containing protein n=1 Tax=Psychrosphaera sp. 1_MG-2023 TaxID=3062643 RepID=UPI0026E2CC3B|nr:SLBB domain-containing protein [Psychrosphaera sp. 1_MG-2023]MDO6719979.1 SLBB domain-containing protein [Psychrosphaera sp. 1_MG-2023]